jgi:hypothetical protein
VVDVLGLQQVVPAVPVHCHGECSEMSTDPARLHHGATQGITPKQLCLPAALPAAHPPF